MKRFFKKLVYGLFYLFMFGGIGYGAYSYMYAEPAPSCFDKIQNQDEEGIDCGGGCVPCELKNISVQKGEPMAFALTDTTSTLLVQVSNPSINYGLRKFDYSIEAFSKFGGPRIAFVRGSSSLYPGEVKYLIESSINVAREDIGFIDFVVFPGDWEEADSLPNRPDIRIISDNRLEELAVPRGYVVTGEARNESNNSIDIKIVAVAKNRAGDIAGASTTILRDIPADGTIVPFSVFLPSGLYAGVDLSYDVLDS